MPRANYHLQGVREVIPLAREEEKVQPLGTLISFVFGEAGLSDSVVNNLIPLRH